jgi:hypothetical protein
MSRRSTGAAGYSGTPLSRKLGVKPDHVVVLAHRPPDWRLPDAPAGARILDPAPSGVPSGVEPASGDGAANSAWAASVDGADIVVAFFRGRDQLERDLPALAERLRPAAALWIAWPRRAAGHTSDITENLLRELVLPTGLVDVKVAALGIDWSGLKFVWRKEHRSRRT